MNPCCKIKSRDHEPLLSTSAASSSTPARFLRHRFSCVIGVVRVVVLARAMLRAPRLRDIRRLRRDVARDVQTLNFARHRVDDALVRGWKILFVRHAIARKMTWQFAPSAQAFRLCRLCRRRRRRLRRRRSRVAAIIWIIQIRQRPANSRRIVLVSRAQLRV